MTADMCSLAQRLADSLRGDGRLVFTGGKLHRSEIGLWHEVPITEQREACIALIDQSTNADRVDDICELMRSLVTDESFFERRRGKQ